MPKHFGITARLSLKCFLLCIMAAVFAFGLHARIELYRAGKSTTPAKISTEKRSAAQVITETVPDDPTPHVVKPHPLGFVLATFISGAELLRSQQIDSPLWKPARLDGLGPSLMLRPPPAQI